MKNLPWIDEIKTVFGLHELRDKAKLAAWLKSDGKTLGDPAALPWCGDAAETAIKRALPGEPMPDPLKQNSYWARNWAKFGIPCAPAYGAIAVFERPGGGGHVGFLVAQDATHFHVLGGNQGDTVSIVRIAKSRLIATRWPLTFLDVPAPLPVRKPADIPRSANEA